MYYLFLSRSHQTNRFRFDPKNSRLTNQSMRVSQDPPSRWDLPCGILLAWFFLAGCSSRGLPHGIFLAGSSSHGSSSRDPPRMVLPRGILLAWFFLTGSSSRVLLAWFFLAGCSSRGLPHGIFLTGSSSRDPPHRVFLICCSLLLQISVKHQTLLSCRNKSEEEFRVFIPKQLSKYK